MLAVTENGTLLFQQPYTATQARCSNGTCAVTPAMALTSGDGSWIVRAANSGGTGPDSEPLTFTATFATPAPPTSLTATAAGATQITLVWTDNASNETGFKVERSPGGPSSWTQIGTAAANATSYADTTVTCGTTCSYRVRATNATSESAHSNTATATCPATYTISGYVRQGTKGGSGVQMKGLPASSKTNANGFYSATVTQGWAGNVAPTQTGYKFSPGTVSYADVGGNIRVDFSAQRAK